MDKNSCWEINLSEICYGLKNMLRADLGFWIMANIYPSRRWQSFSSLLFGSLLLTYVYAGGKQHWSLDFYSFPWNSSPWNSSPYSIFFTFLWTQTLYLGSEIGCGSFCWSYLSLGTLEITGKRKKKMNDCSNLVFAHLLPCMKLFFLTLFTVFCQVSH